MVKSKKAIEKPVWLKYTEKEVKEIILALAKKDSDLTAEKIGLILRDTYGIPKTKIYGFKIKSVLNEAGLYKNPDFANLTKKVEKLQKHIEKNQQDKRTKRSLNINQAREKKTRNYLERRKEIETISNKELRKMRKAK